jgi:hypothetical protein
MRRVNNYFLYCLCILFAFNAIAAEPTTAPATPLATLDLWPGVAPHEKGDIAAEYNKTAAEGKVRITNVTKPTIAIYKPSPEKDTGTAVMISPAGRTTCSPPTLKAIPSASGSTPTASPRSC